METIVTVIISVLSYTFQISGAIILLRWCIVNLDMKVKQACIDNHSGPLWVHLSSSNSSITLSKADLQESAKSIYTNIVAFVDLIVGYSLAIFISDVSISPWYILVFVMFATLFVVCFERFIIDKIASKKYNSDCKVVNDGLSIRPGTQILQILDDSNTDPMNSKNNN